jgi:hypothetical protein
VVDSLPEGRIPALVGVREAEGRLPADSLQFALGLQGACAAAPGLVLALTDNMPGIPDRGRLEWNTGDLVQPTSPQWCLGSV